MNLEVKWASILLVFIFNPLLSPKYGAHNFVDLDGFYSEMDICFLLFIYKF